GAAVGRGGGWGPVAPPADPLSDVQGHVPELMGVALPAAAVFGSSHLDVLLAAAEGKDALIIGPGIPRGPETHLLLEELLARLDIPVLVDADGLNAIAGHSELLARSRAPVVLTPHPGEMARLADKRVAEVQAHRIATPTAFARAHRAVVVLKGARTVVADPDGQVRVNPTGNPGMATGGTGDVLSGMVGAFLAQGLAPLDAASVGVLAHGLAGDAAARRWGRLGLIASDLTAALGEVWTEWGR